MVPHARSYSSFSMRTVWLLTSIRVLVPILDEDCTWSVAFVGVRIFDEDNRWFLMLVSAPLLSHPYTTLSKRRS